MVAADPIDLLAQRVLHLEGWKESQERFAQQFSRQLDQISERIFRVEEELKYLDRKWEDRFNQQQVFSEQRFSQQLGIMEERFKEIRVRFWWLVVLQFTILLAIIGMLFRFAR